MGVRLDLYKNCRKTRHAYKVPRLFRYENKSWHYCPLPRNTTQFLLRGVQSGTKSWDWWAHLEVWEAYRGIGQNSVGSWTKDHGLWIPSTSFGRVNTQSPVYVREAICEKMRRISPTCSIEDHSPSQAIVFRAAPERKDGVRLDLYKNCRKTRHEQKVPRLFRYENKSWNYCSLPRNTTQFLLRWV
jgi:hypothetical protein